MGRSQQTFNKKEREKKKKKKKQDKRERYELRKKEKEERGKLSLEEQFSYIDEYGNLTSEKPDPRKKRKIKAEDISLGVPDNSQAPPHKERKGVVKFYNDDKGYGFIRDDIDGENIFLHANNVSGQVKELDRVTYDIQKGPKGPVAINVVPV